MSIYYECRFNKLILNLSERPDIIQWLKDCKNKRDEVRKGIYLNKDIETPKELRKGSRCTQLFYNSFVGKNAYDNDLYLNINDESNVIIDYCLGNKNKDNDIEEVLLLFSKYYVSGNIILWNEDNYIRFNIWNIKNHILNNNIIKFNIEYYNLPNECWQFSEEAKEIFNENILDEKDERLINENRLYIKCPIALGMITNIDIRRGTHNLGYNHKEYCKLRRKLINKQIKELRNKKKPSFTFKQSCHLSLYEIINDYMEFNNEKNRRRRK